MIEATGRKTNRSVKPTGEWAWARMLDASGEFRPGDRPTCFAYMKDRIAVAYPQMGVKVWMWVNGKIWCAALLATNSTGWQECGSNSGLF